MDSLIRQASDLHSAPGVARSVLDMTRTDEFVVEKLVDCIEMDPALTARILATVNSARFGLSGRVSNLRQAIALLGRRTLRTVALAFSVLDTFTRGINAEVYTKYWQRSLSTSLVASQLCSGQSDVDANDAYTAGLLADIGVLVLAQFEAETYLPLHEEHQHGAALVDAERRVFGFDHAELGSRLLESWQFPALLAMAVAAHHDADEAAVTPMSRLVRAGNLMPAAIWIAENSEFHAAFEWFQAKFGFDIERFIDLALEVNHAVAEEAEIYQVKGLIPVDCDTLQREARRLLEATCQQS